MMFARILFVMTATAAMVVFGAQNWDHVPVQVIFGPPARIRLVFLLLIAAAAGYIAAVVRGFTRELRLRGELRQLRRQLRQGDGAREITVVNDGGRAAHGWREEGDGETLGAADDPGYTHERV